MDENKRDDFIEHLVSAPHLFTEAANKCESSPHDILDLTDNDSEQPNAATESEVSKPQPICNTPIVCQSANKTESLQQLLAKNTPQTPTLSQMWHTGIDKTMKASPRRSGKKTRSVASGKGVFAKGSSQRQGHIARRQNKQKEIASMSVVDRCVDDRIPIVTSKGQTILSTLQSTKPKK